MKTVLIIAALVFSSINLYSQEVWNLLSFQVHNGNAHGAIHLVDENNIHIATDNGYFYRSTNGGVTWDEYESGISELFLDLIFFDENIGLTVGTNGTILRTIDSGDNWNLISSGTTEDLISTATNTSNEIWITGDNGILLHSIDQGVNWQIENTPSSERLNSIQFKDENIGYIAGKNGVLLYTEDGGISWTALQVPTTLDLFSVSITDTNVILLAGDTDVVNIDYLYEANEIIKSSDNLNWTFLPVEMAWATDLYFQNENLGFIFGHWALSNGICYTQINKTIDLGVNLTESFYLETPGSNCQFIGGMTDMKFVTDEVGFALVGNKILTTQEIVAGINEFDRNISIKLYPNPANEGFINIELVSSYIENITIDIIDMMGRVIYSVENMQSLTTIETQNLKSGIYFVNISEENKLIESKKIVVN